MPQESQNAIRLDQVDPKAIKVLAPPPAPAAPPGATLRLDQIDPRQIQVIKPEEPSVFERAGQAVHDLGAGGGIAGTTPIIGSAGRWLGEHVRAGVDYLADKALDAASDPSLRQNRSYSAILEGIQQSNKQARARLSEQHPVLAGAQTLTGGVAGAAMLPMPGTKAVLGPSAGLGYSVGEGVIQGAPIVARAGGSALARIAGTGATSYADKLLETGSAEEAQQAGTLGAGIQAGIEALPIVGAPLKPAARAIADVAAPPLKWVGGKLVQAIGGVAPKNVAYYLENQGAVRGAETLADIEGQVAQHIGLANQSVDEARLMHQAAKDKLATLTTTLKAAAADTKDRLRAQVATARDSLKQSFMSQIQGLKQKAIPLEQADAIVGLLKNEKAVLGGLSEQADDALERSGLNFEKQSLLEFIDKVGHSLGVGENHTLVGDSAVAAATKLAGLRDRIAEGFGDIISAPDLRGILKQVRRDINFDMGAADFNDALNGARKEFTGRISDVLKDKIPEYGQIMGRMHELSSTLDQMGQFFNTREQAMASLSTLAAGRSPRAQLIDDVVSRYGAATGNDVRTGLANYQAAQRVLQSPLEQDTLRRGLPEFGRLEKARSQLDAFSKRRAEEIAAKRAASPEFAEVGATRDALADAMTGAKPYAGWTPGTQSIPARLKSIMSGKGINDVKTLERLSSETGINFVKMLEDRRVADAFEKGYMHGSRNVNLWSILGAFAKGGAFATEEERAAGRAAGGALGGFIDQAGPKMTQKMLDAYLALRNSRFLPALERAAKNGPAALMAQHVMLMKQPEYRKQIEGEK